jgi:hypothetical protein
VAQEIEEGPAPIKAIFSLYEVGKFFKDGFRIYLIPISLKILTAISYRRWILMGPSSLSLTLQFLAQSSVTGHS